MTNIKLQNKLKKYPDDMIVTKGYCGFAMTLEFIKKGYVKPDKTGDYDYATKRFKDSIEVIVL